jgi:hypothetical protein
MRSSERLANQVTATPQDAPEVDKYKFGRASNWNWQQLRQLGVRFNVKIKWNADRFLKTKGAYPAEFNARIHSLFLVFLM